MGFPISILFILFTLIVPHAIASSSSPVINEFSSASSTDDWVELYNPTDTEIDLSLYRLRDDSATNKLDLSTMLAPHSFIFFDWTSKLNNDGDLIRLVLISTDAIVDELGYGDKGTISNLSETQTIGRKVDGGGEWVIFSSATKGQSNNGTTIVNTPTPIPTATPTPTRTPTPTKVPTETPTSANMAVLAASETGSDDNVSRTITKSPFRPSSYPEILLSTKSSEKVNKNDKSPVRVLVKKATDIHKNTVFFIVGGALLILSCGILIFLWQRRNKEII